MMKGRNAGRYVIAFVKVTGAIRTAVRTLVSVCSCHEEANNSPSVIDGRQENTSGMWLGYNMLYLYTFIANVLWLFIRYFFMCRRYLKILRSSCFSANSALFHRGWWQHIGVQSRLLKKRRWQLQMFSLSWSKNSWSEIQSACTFRSGTLEKPCTCVWWVE